MFERKRSHVKMCQNNYMDTSSIEFIGNKEQVSMRSSFSHFSEQCHCQPRWSWPQGRSFLLSPSWVLLPSAWWQISTLSHWKLALKSYSYVTDTREKISYDVFLVRLRCIWCVLLYNFTWKNSIEVIRKLDNILFHAIKTLWYVLCNDSKIMLNTNTTFKKRKKPTVWIDSILWMLPQPYQSSIAKVTFNVMLNSKIHHSNVIKIL